ncbi:MAG: hypothetical protein GHHEDOFH_01563 [Pseudorhodoplanes sp.]|nr:hypothetical protein [Pseudorhodoplanes sp.]
MHEPLHKRLQRRIGQIPAVSLVKIERPIIDYFEALGWDVKEQDGEYVIWPGNGGEISLTAIAVAIKTSLEKE